MKSYKVLLMSLSSLAAAHPDPRITRRCLPVVTGLSACSRNQCEWKLLPMHVQQRALDDCITYQGLSSRPLQGWLLRAQAGSAATLVSTLAGE